MLKKIFISAVLLLAVLSFVVSLLKGNNNSEKTVTVPDRVAVINIEGTIVCGADSKENLFNQANGVTSGSIMKQIREAAADDSVKALLLRIDSGGGSALKRKLKSPLWQLWAIQAPVLLIGLQPVLVIRFMLMLRL